MSGPYSKLEFTECLYGGERKIRYLEPVIDGQGLGGLSDIAQLDVVSSLRLDDFELALKSLRALMPEQTSSAQEVLIFVCPLCADIGCGAVQMSVSQSESGIEWGELFYVNGFEKPVPMTLGPFRFRVAEYRSKMSEALATLTDNL